MPLIFSDIKWSLKNKKKGRVLIYPKHIDSSTVYSSFFTSHMRLPPFFPSVSKNRWHILPPAQSSTTAQRRCSRRWLSLPSPLTHRPQQVCLPPLLSVICSILLAENSIRVFGMGVLPLLYDRWLWIWLWFLEWMLC